MLNATDVTTDAASDGTERTSPAPSRRLDIPQSGTNPECAGKVPEALDSTVFASLRQLDADEPGFLAELVGDFLAGAGARMEAIRHAFRRGGPGIASEAHGLKGISGTVGAFRMADLAGRVERTRDEALLEELEAEYRRLRLAFAAELAG